MQGRLFAAKRVYQELEIQNEELLIEVKNGCTNCSRLLLYLPGSQQAELKKKLEPSIQN